MYSDSDVDIECVDDLESNDQLTDADKIFSRSVIKHKTIKQEMGLSEECVRGDRTGGALRSVAFKIVNVDALMSKVVDLEDPRNYTYEDNGTAANLGKVVAAYKYGTRSKSRIANSWQKSRDQRRSLLKSDQRYPQDPSNSNDSPRLLGKKKKSPKANSKAPNVNFVVLPASENVHKLPPAKAVPREHAYSARDPARSPAPEAAGYDSDVRDESCLRYPDRTYERQAYHNVQERERRVQLSNLVAELQQMLPSFSGHQRVPKHAVLQEAKTYCDLLGHQSNVLTVVHHDAKVRQSRLKERVKQLRRHFTREQLRRLGMAGAPLDT